jgi:hypothetical protein
MVAVRVSFFRTTRRFWRRKRIHMPEVSRREIWLWFWRAMSIRLPIARFPTEKCSILPRRG